MSLIHVSNSLPLSNPTGIVGPQNYRWSGQIEDFPSPRTGSFVARSNVNKVSWFLILFARKDHRIITGPPSKSYIRYVKISWYRSRIKSCVLKASLLKKSPSKLRKIYFWIGKGHLYVSEQSLRTGSGVGVLKIFFFSEKIKILIFNNSNFFSDCLENFVKVRTVPIIFVGDLSAFKKIQYFKNLRVSKKVSQLFAKNILVAWNEKFCNSVISTLRNVLLAAFVHRALDIVLT